MSVPTRMRRRPSGLAASAAATLAIAGLALAGAPALAPAKPKPHHGNGQALTYELVFQVKKGSYGSQYSAAGLNQGEIDNFQATATYPGLAIPRRGGVSIKKAAPHPEKVSGDTSGPAWEEYGNGDGATFHCQGDLESDINSPPPLLKGAGKTVKHHDVLSLRVQVATRLVVKNATGDLNANACSSYDGATALLPASRAYMPEMLTAVLDVPLKPLRALKQGKSMTVDVTGQDNAAKLPPSNCTDAGGATCTQQLGWKGEVRVTRTG